jgi:hypothetical protein
MGPSCKTMSKPYLKCSDTGWSTLAVLANCIVQVPKVPPSSPHLNKFNFTSLSKICVVLQCNTPICVARFATLRQSKLKLSWDYLNCYRIAGPGFQNTAIQRTVSSGSLKSKTKYHWFLVTSKTLKNLWSLWKNW